MSTRSKNKAPSKEEQLDRLIGRPLVPFFLEGSNGDKLENTTMQVDHKQTFQLHAPLNVRVFKDGYFQKAKTVRRASSVPVSPAKPPLHKNPKNNCKNQRTPKAGSITLKPSSPVDSQTISKQSNKTQISRPHGKCGQGKGQTHWAGGAYLNSPSPKLVPMPAFLNQNDQNNPLVANSGAGTEKPGKSKGKGKKRSKPLASSVPLQSKNSPQNQCNDNVLSFFDAYKRAQTPSPRIDSGFVTPVRATSPLVLGGTSEPTPPLASLDAGSFLLQLVKGETKMPQPVNSGVVVPPMKAGGVEPTPQLLFRRSDGVTAIAVASS